MLMPPTIFDYAVRQEHERPAPGDTMLGSLLQQAIARHGARTAVTFGEDSITYGELGKMAGRVAAAIEALGLPRNALVAIYLERSIGLVGAMVGTIQAGAAYLPLDASYPAARVLETLADARPAAIITDQSLAERVLDAGAPLILVTSLTDVATAEQPWTRTQPDDLAYVIYTSGSTGRPKGVMVTQQNLMRLFSQTEGWFHFNERDVWTMFHSFAFDFSVWEMWGCMLSGGRLIVVPFEVSRSPSDFYTLLSEGMVTVLNQTPSAFSLLIQEEARGRRLPLSLRVVILGGEALNLRSLGAWFKRHGEQRPEIVNMYGITETTVHVTYRRIFAADAVQESESVIGVPMSDLQIYLLDENLRSVAEGETGEICIAGEGVAQGYLRRAELTAERFVANPFQGPGLRLYRSGDLARRRPDGELVYLGRADRQVKINGFRIELGEVEAALARVAGITQACVTLHPDAHGAKRLAAYFVAEGRTSNVRSVGESLARLLPAHMRPAFYVQLDALPLTANGKIDRAALPPPQGCALAAPGSETFETAVEARLSVIWKQVLGIAQVGVEQNFFDVGGTSLSLIEVRTRMQQELDRSIPVTWFFEFATIRSLSRQLSAEAPPDQLTTSPAAGNAQRQRESFARMKALRSATR